MPSRGLLYSKTALLIMPDCSFPLKSKHMETCKNVVFLQLLHGFYLALTVVSCICCSCIVCNIWSMSSSLGEAFEKQVAFSVAMMLIFHQGIWDNSRTSLADLPFSLTSLTIEVQRQWLLFFFDKVCSLWDVKQSVCLTNICWLWLQQRSQIWRIWGFCGFESFIWKRHVSSRFVPSDTLPLTVSRLWPLFSVRSNHDSPFQARIYSVMFLNKCRSCVVCCAKMFVNMKLLTSL